MSRLIFVVEDDQFIRRDLVELLELENYEAKPFSNGKDALEALSTRDPLPYLVILDLMMPVMNGYEFLDEIAKVERFHNLPVLVVSADRQTTAIRKAQVRGFLSKPIDLEQLLGSIKGLTEAGTVFA